MFDMLVRDDEGLWRWPDKPWLPLSFSLKATRRQIFSIGSRAMPPRSSLGSK
jgi:hypothetical protein